MCTALRPSVQAHARTRTRAHTHTPQGAHTHTHTRTQTGKSRNFLRELLQMLDNGTRAFLVFANSWRIFSCFASRPSLMPLVRDDVVFVLLLVPGPEPEPAQALTTPVSMLLVRSVARRARLSFRWIGVRAPKQSLNRVSQALVRLLVASQGALLSKEFNAKPTTMSSSLLCWSPAPSLVKG